MFSWKIISYYILDWKLFFSLSFLLSCFSKFPLCSCSSVIIRRCSDVGFKKFILVGVHGFLVSLVLLLIMENFLSSTIATSPILSVSSLEIWFDMYYKFLYLFSMLYIFSLSFTLCAVFWKFPNIYSTSEIYLFSFENHLLNFIKRILFWRRSFGPCQPYFVSFIVYGLLHRFSFSF